MLVILFMMPTFEYNASKKSQYKLFFGDLLKFVPIFGGSGK